MGKLVIAILLISLIGFIYSPYEVTSRYAEAVEKRDLKAYLALTDVASYRESFKESMRPVFADWARARVPLNQAPAKTEADMAAMNTAFERRLAAIFSPGNADKILDVTRIGRDEFKFTKKGWRSPFVFVAVDNMDDTKLIFEFQGLNGWRLAKIDASRDTMQRELNRELRLPGW